MVVKLPAKRFGDLLSEYRQSRRWSRDEVADRARERGHEITGSYIAKIENGETDPRQVSLAKIEALAAGLGVEREALLGAIDGQSLTLSAALKIPGVVTGDRMGEIGHARPWIPWEDDESAPLPFVAVVGEVGCGQLRLEDPGKARRKFPVPADYAKQAAFAVIARGNSLNALGPPRHPINDGDLLLVRKVREPEHGMVVVAYVPDEGAAAKVYWRKSGAARLRPWSTNPEHEEIAVDDAVQIVGEVFAVLPAPRELEGE